MKNDTVLDIIHNREAKGAWNEYLASGLVRDIGSFHLCLTVHALSKSGMANFFLTHPCFSSEDVCRKYNTHIASYLLEYLVVRNILVKTTSDNTYSLTEYGRRCLSPVSLAQIGFYIEAYSPVLNHMADLVTNKKIYGREVLRDGMALGAHCATLFTIFHTEIILKIVNEKGLKSILDLGCGGGAMLIDACKNALEIKGFGLDIAPGAIEFANNLCREEGLEDRLSFAVGDAFDPKTWPDYKNIDAISAVGALHEHFRDGEESIIRMLNIFASLIKEGRTKYFILGEPELYYDNEENDPDLFLVHIFTSQGFPRRRELWMDVLDKSNLKCERVYTRVGIGPRFCFYVLSLK